MAGITEIRGRMRSIQQTLKITNAMYLISSAKVKKARKQLQEVEPYFDRLAKTILDIFRHSPQLQHRLHRGATTSPRRSARPALWSSQGDKGLAGAYNHNVLKLAESYLARKQDSTLFLIGQMGRHYFEKKNIPIDAEFMYTVQDPTLDRAQDICDTLVDLYERGALDEIYLVFTPLLFRHAHGAGDYQAAAFGQGHAQRPAGPSPRPTSTGDVVRYEPSPEAVLDVLVPGVIRGYIFAALVESFCSEQSSRMSAMDSASESAQGHAENAVPRVQPGPPRGPSPRKSPRLPGGAEALNQQ